MADYYKPICNRNIIHLITNDDFITNDGFVLYYLYKIYCEMRYFFTSHQYKRYTIYILYFYNGFFQVK